LEKSRTALSPARFFSLLHSITRRDWTPGVKRAANSLQPEANASSPAEPPAPRGLLWWRRSNKKDVRAGCRMQSHGKEPAHSLTSGHGMDVISNGADPKRSWVVFQPGEVLFWDSHKRCKALGLAGALHPL